MGWLKTAEGLMEYSAASLPGGMSPSARSSASISRAIQGLEDLAIEMLARGHRCATSRMLSRTRTVGFFCRRPRYSFPSTLRNFLVVCGCFMC